MKFELNHGIEILERTPEVLDKMLSGLSDEWLMCNEGAETWCAYDVIGHLIHGEKTDWLDRLNIILSQKSDLRFTPFDRFAQFEESKGKNIQTLLKEFKELRKRNVDVLKQLALQDSDYSKKGIHPAFGEVTLSQLLSTWVVHDFTHISQITRVMAKQYKEEVGPWVAYLSVLK
jgi:uncharacterized damage-inducible protein DinB